MDRPAVIRGMRTALACAVFLAAIPGAALAKVSVDRVDPASVYTIDIMEVDGHIDVGPDGRLLAYTIDSKIAPKLAARLQSTVSRWSFEPVTLDGKAVAATANMRITLHAVEKPGGTMAVDIDNVTFPDSRDLSKALPDFDRGYTVSVRYRVKPVYPEMDYGNINAMVMLYLQVGADGRVRDAVPVQTAFYDLKASPGNVAVVARKLQQAAVDAARLWTFDVVFAPGQVPQDTVVITSPIMFTEMGFRLPAGGEWRTVMRTQWKSPEWWQDPAAPRVGTSDPSGTSQAPGAGIKLSTDVSGTAL